MVLAGVGIIQICLTIILRSLQKAGLLNLLTVLLFFSFPGIQANLVATLGAGSEAVAGALAVGFVALILCLGLYLVWKVRFDFRAANAILNAALGALVCFQLASIAVSLSSTPRWYLPPVRSSEGIAPSAPDIFYVVLDGYAREDVLSAIYSYDNTEFLEFLKTRGFFVSKGSHSNYHLTTLSVASSLNMVYLDTLAEKMGTDSEDYRPLILAIQESRVVSFLRKEGYRFIAFPTGFHSTDVGAAADEYVSSGSLSDFHNLLLIRTPLAVPAGWGLFLDPYEDHRRRILFTLEKVPSVGGVGPVFVLAHVFAPHPPFVFAEDGSLVRPPGPYSTADGNFFPGSKQEYIDGYRGQIHYLNSQLTQMVDRMIRTRNRPFVLVLQSDHGPRSTLHFSSLEDTDTQECFPILCAVYASESAPAFYDGMTPVNVFRLVLDKYFGTDLGVLEDEMYFPNVSRPYDYVRVDAAE